MDLIQQQNVLKGLTDESLQQELAQSSTGSPPYLVATELSRRKRQRESYEGEKARKAGKTTVMEDLAGPSGLAPAMPQAASMIPQTAAPQMQDQGIAAFADGGLVGADGGLDYASIGQRYAESLEALPGRQDRARAMALIMAGAGIAGGKSSNALTNIGQGVMPAVEMYGKELDTIDSQEQDMLRSALDLQRVQNSDSLQTMRFDWEQSNAEKNRELDRERLNQPPASIQEFQAYEQMSPEQQDEYDRLNPPYNPNGLTAATREAKEFDDIFQQVDKSLPQVGDSFDAVAASPEELSAMIDARFKKAQIVTYQRIKASMGDAAARRYADQAGISSGDILTTSTVPGGNPSDPMGLRN